MGDGGEYGGETDERDGDSYEYKEHDENEREVKDLLDELEREMDEYNEEADELAKDLEREMEDEAKARDIADELEKEMEHEKPSKDIEDESRELDGFENDLGHDLNETRDDLHDDFVNDMERQLEGASTKESTTDSESTESDTGASSEMTESSESYGDAGGGMAYAMETKGGSEGEAQAETASDKEDEMEGETQESAEHEPTGDSAEDSEQEKFTNRIEGKEESEQETEPQYFSEGGTEKEAEEDTRQSELEDYADKSIDEKTESQEPATGSSQQEVDEDVSESDVEKPVNEPTETEEPDSQSNSEERTHEFEDHVEEPKVSEEVDEITDDVTEPTSETESEVSKPEISEVESDETAHTESENESTEDFMRRAKEILDEMQETDDNYDYVQDPLTGEMQRVPRILSDYETEEQKHRRRLRDLFAELSEKEREQFKSLVREQLEDDDDLAGEVEKAWSRVVEKADEISHRDLMAISPRTGEDIDSKEVCRLYIEEGMSLRKMGKHFGFRDGRKTMKRILEAEGVEIRPVGFQEIDINPDELYRLYFEEGKGLNECAKHFGCKSTDPIHRVFREQGWKTRYQETYEMDIDPEEVFRLYDEGNSIRKIADHYGVSYGRIHREFIEHGKEYGQEIQVNHEDIRRLYFDEGQSRDEVCETLGFSMKVFDRVFKEQQWEARPVGFQPIEIDIEEFKRLYHEGLTYQQLADHFQMSYRTVCRVSSEIELEVRKWPARSRVNLDELYRMYYEDEEKIWKIAEHFGVSQRTINIILNEHNWEKRRTKSARDIRDEMFGTECVSCGKPKEIVHRKDGTPHHRKVTWAKKSLKTLDPDDWVALCDPCHRLTHALMTSFGCEWKDIEEILQELSRKWLQ